MFPPGEDRPPERPGRSSDEPEYTVYGRGGESRKEKPPPSSKKPRDSEGKAAGEGDKTGRGGKPEKPEAGGKEPPKPAAKAEAGGPKAAEPKRPEGPEGKPEYRVYRSRPSIMDRFRLRKPDMQALRRERRGPPRGGWRGRVSSFFGRRWWRWVLLAAVAWLLISFISFAISAQIQKGKLPDSAKEALAGGPFPLFGQNILILGGDRRGKTQRNANGTEGQGPPRADTIMVVHAALGAFRKLSIPRDTYAAIPDCGVQKINASFACNTNSVDGNPAETIKTVEHFLGIDINHIVIVDFDGFADFINTIGGVTVDVPENKNVSSTCRLKNRTLVVAGDVDGGKENGGISLGLTAGEHTLQGDKALAFARLRHNICDPSEGDLARAARQQLVLNGIKSRMTSITRFPYNFIKGPWIGWNAPKAFVSDMGGFTLPQLALTSIFGGSSTNVLKPFANGPGDSLLISQAECEKAVEKLIGGKPARQPACSPTG